MLEPILDNFALVDAWLATKPNTPSFTYETTDRTIKSRLDRFYIEKCVTKSSVRFSNIIVHFSDHKAICVKIPSKPPTKKIPSIPPYFQTQNTLTELKGFGTIGEMKNTLCPLTNGGILEKLR